MARILITSFGSFGDVLPYMGLALGLRARGHQPILALPEFYREVVEAEGLELRPVGPDLDPTDLRTVERILDPIRGTEFLLRDLLLGSLEKSHADLHAAAAGVDLLIGHAITFAAPIVAEQRGIPWVSTVLSPMLFFSRHDFPVFSPFPWAKRLEGVPGVRSLMLRGARTVTGRWTKPVARLRERQGLSRGSNPIFEGQHSPYLALGLFSRVLAEPQPDWPSNVVLAGAIPYAGPAAEAKLAPELEDFLAAGDPPIVFTLGSAAVWAPGTFFRESAAAVRRLGARGVLLAGPAAPELEQEGGSDLFVIERAAHASLFPRASAVVHQGGIGTLQHGLRAGVPTLVVPHAHDQYDNAHRVERLGASLTLPPRKYGSAAAADCIETLLSDASYRERAARVAEVVRQEDGVGNACDAVEMLLGTMARPQAGGAAAREELPGGPSDAPGAAT